MNVLRLRVYESSDFETPDPQEDMKLDKNIHISLLFVKDTANSPIKKKNKSTQIAPQET